MPRGRSQSSGRKRQERVSGPIARSKSRSERRSRSSSRRRSRRAHKEAHSQPLIPFHTPGPKSYSHPPSWDKASLSQLVLRVLNAILWVVLTYYATFEVASCLTTLDLEWYYTDQSTQQTQQTQQRQTTPDVTASNSSAASTIVWALLSLVPLPHTPKAAATAAAAVAATLGAANILPCFFSRALLGALAQS